MRKHIKKIIDNSDEKHIKIIIPAAGIGRRMKSYGSKSLLRINGDYLIHQQLKVISQSIKSYEIILVAGFDSERLMNNTPEDIIKIENENYYNTNVSRSIAMGMRASQDHESILIIFGDLLFNREALENIDYSKSCIVISNHMEESEVGCNISNKDNLEYMMFDLNNKWGHVLYLTGKELRLFKKLIYNKQNDKKFCFEIINEVMNQGGKFKCIMNDNIKIIDIDTSKDLQKAQELIK